MVVLHNPEPGKSKESKGFLRVKSVLVTYISIDDLLASTTENVNPSDPVDILDYIVQGNNGTGAEYVTVRDTFWALQDWGENSPPSEEEMTEVTIVPQIVK